MCCPVNIDNAYVQVYASCMMTLMSSHHAEEVNTEDLPPRLQLCCLQCAEEGPPATNTNDVLSMAYRRVELELDSSH